MVDGTFNVAEAAVEANVSKLVATSSADVYGMAEAFPTPEDHHPYANRTFYGAAKTFNEGLLRSFNDRYGLAYAGVRYFNVYGPRIERAVNPVPRRLAETTRARQLLGFEATIDLESRLRNLVDWWRAARLAGAPTAAVASVR